MTEDDKDTNLTPQREPAPTSLVSAESLSLTDYPTVHISESRRDALIEHARRIAESWHGTEQNHVTGLLGEDAVAQGLGIADSLNVEVYPDGGDGGVDLTYCGASIDVKTVGRHRSNPALTVDAYAPLTSDYYVLVSRIGPADFRLIGYAPRDFVANAPVLQYEGRPYHIVGQEYLFPFPSL